MSVAKKQKLAETCGSMAQRAARWPPRHLRAQRGVNNAGQGEVAARAAALAHADAADAAAAKRMRKQKLQRN